MIKGRDFMTGLPRSVEVKTNEIVRAIDNELREIIKAIKCVFQEPPPELSADIIDQWIVMTGGTSLLRNMTELVFRRTGVKAILANDPLYCVAKGTGVALNHLDTYKKSIIAKKWRISLSSRWKSGFSIKWTISQKFLNTLKISTTLIF